jgi:hypothetical protein
LKLLAEYVVASLGTLNLTVELDDASTFNYAGTPHTLSEVSSDPNELNNPSSLSVISHPPWKEHSMLDAMEDTVAALATVAVPAAQWVAWAPSNQRLGATAVLKRGTPEVQVAVT